MRGSLKLRITSGYFYCFFVTVEGIVNYNRMRDKVVAGTIPGCFFRHAFMVADLMYANQAQEYGKSDISGGRGVKK